MPRELLFDTRIGRFEIATYVVPPLGLEEVRVRLELAAPKHGTEAHAWTGEVNRGRRWDPDLSLFRDRSPDDSPCRPALLGIGNMAVGVVDAVGDAVHGLRPGDRVYGYMPVREVHQVAATRVRPLPVGLSAGAAVCIDPAHVAFVALRDGKVRLGDDVAVFGLGAIGLFTVQAARAAGVGRIIAVDPLAMRRERARQAGADAAVDPTAADVGVAIKETTEGQGAFEGRLAILPLRRLPRGGG